MPIVYLRTRRERLGFTQAALAARTKIAQNTISKLETNARARPEFATVAALASGLGIDPRDLRFGPDPGESRRRPKVRIPA
jgi:transcriptional regulator with XRE-family HTH domain